MFFCKKKEKWLKKSTEPGKKEIFHYICTKF